MIYFIFIELSRTVILLEKLSNELNSSRCDYDSNIIIITYCYSFY